MDASRMPRPTKRLRIRTHAPVNVTRCGAAAHTGAALRTWTDCPAWFVGRVRHKAAVHHPLTGWGRRPSALPGIAPSADGALDDWRFRAVRGAGVSSVATGGYFARCGGRPGLCPWSPRFGLSAARWQEWSARNFASGQGVVSQPYWMYGKKPHRRHGGKGPASTADTRVVGSPHKKKIE